MKPYTLPPFLSCVLTRGGILRLCVRVFWTPSRCKKKRILNARTMQFWSQIWNEMKGIRWNSFVFMTQICCRFIYKENCFTFVYWWCCSDRFRYFHGESQQCFPPCMKNFSYSFITIFCVDVLMQSVHYDFLYHFFSSFFIFFLLDAETQWLPSRDMFVEESLSVWRYISTCIVNPSP